VYLGLYLSFSAVEMKCGRQLASHLEEGFLYLPYALVNQIAEADA
jgi:hypothetical protein